MAKVTMVAFLVVACVAALKEFPIFNSSLDGDELVLKRYYNIGFAADTPGGLVVPVIKNADRKGLLEIARELAALSAKAREGKLGPADMQGSTFTISSLGGIGGTSFTPIVNAPEVAILGVTRAAMKPVWNGQEFAPRLMVPLSLVLRPPRDRRRRRRAVHRPPRPRARGPAQGAAVSSELEVRVPDIGDFTDVPVIEIHVAPGDEVASRGSARHARIRQGDDGRARAARGHGQAAAGQDRRPRVGGQRAARRSRRRRCRPSDRAAPHAERRPRRRAPPRRSPAPAAPAASRDGRTTTTRRCVVLGAGPGGYTAAFRAADLGLKTS